MVVVKKKTVKEVLDNHGIDVTYSIKQHAFIAKHFYFNYPHEMTAEKFKEKVISVLPLAVIISATNKWNSWPITSWFEVIFKI